jgi:Rnl2 family RNA ligase
MRSQKGDLLPVVRRIDAPLACASTAVQLDAIAAARDNDFVVTEKIHGANLLLSVDVETRATQFGARRGWIGDDDEFFGVHTITAELELHAVRLLDAPALAGARRVCIFGELFGGRYPTQTEAAHRFEAVQEEILYSPALHFCAFDVAVERADGLLAFLDYRIAAPALEAAGFMWSRPLAIVPFNEAIAFNVDFQTTIPRLLGLPAIENSTNTAEGVVVKCVVETEVPLKKGTTRAILKLKHPRFVERVHEFAEQKSASGEASVSSFLRAHVNANRVNAAISKLGRPKAGSAGNTLRQALQTEILEDLLRDALADEDGFGTRQFHALTDAARARLRAELSDAIAALLPK